ncbi:SDR family oxidoreductase [Mycobacterium neumannii]|uniref:SDR family oxidoreductase n=1 Tax=Mycobacterium neumannii TaxID=2048551 RepID=UPI003AB6ED3B
MRGRKGTPIQPLDVSDRRAVADYSSAVVKHYGVVHQLYNNAGVADGAALLDNDYETYERIVDINLWGVINGTKEFLPHLIASSDGHLVNISSLNGLLGQASMSAYCTTKFAVRGFTESLRAEMLTEGHPVRVTVVHPGGIATNIATSALNEAERAGREVRSTDPIASPGSHQTRLAVGEAGFRLTTLLWSRLRPRLRLSALSGLGARAHRYGETHRRRARQ